MVISAIHSKDGKAAGVAKVSSMVPSPRDSFAPYKISSFCGRSISSRP